MTAAGIVPALDEVEDGEARVGRRTEVLPIEQLALEGREEALAQRVVVRVADRTHGRPDAGRATALAEGYRGVLAALIRVMNDVRRPTLRDGHIQRGQDELGPEMGFHRPADHAPTPRIEHDGEIQEAGPGRHVGDVRDPQLIRARAGELAVDEIRRRPGRLVAHRRAERLPPAHALQPGAPHQPGHPLTANVEAAGGELGMNPGDAVGPARLAMDRLDLRGEFHIGPGAGRQRPLAPGEVPAGGDTQHAAQPGDRMEGLMGGHELESLDGLEVVSRANPPASFFRISRSSRSCRTSRRSRRTSSRSSVVRPSVRWPASSAACFTQFRIAWAEGSNCRPSSSGVRPFRTNSTSRARNSGGYGRWLFGIVDAPFRPNSGVSTKPGQLQTTAIQIAAEVGERAELAGGVRDAGPVQLFGNLQNTFTIGGHPEDAADQLGLVLVDHAHALLGLPSGLVAEHASVVESARVHALNLLLGR